MKRIGIAESMSSYAKKHLDPVELNEIQDNLPCDVFTTGEKSTVDHYRLVRLDNMEELVHPVMVNISKIP